MLAIMHTYAVGNKAMVPCYRNAVHCYAEIEVDDYAVELIVVVIDV